MINPLRSEEDAFRFVLIVAALLAPIALVAVIWSTEAALAVAGGLAFGLVFGMFVLRREEPQPKADLRRAPGDGRYRILVVANETMGGRALREEISERARGADTEMRVVCPALNTKIRHWTSDEDQARADAGRRLEALTAELRSAGLEAAGDIGDDDPVQAMEDALRLFSADEVIISTHPEGRSNWLEKDVIERARDRFDIPVRHVVVDLEEESREERGASGISA